MILKGPELTDEQKLNSGYHIPLEKLTLLPAGRSGIRSIEVTLTETIVTYGYMLSWDAQWSITSDYTYLEDVDTKDRYFIRNIDRGIVPLNRLVMVMGARGLLWSYKMYFPPLKPGVRAVNFIEADVPGKDRYIPRQHRAASARYLNLNLGEYAPKNEGPNAITIYR